MERSDELRRRAIWRTCSKPDTDLDGRGCGLEIADGGVGVGVGAGEEASAYDESTEVSQLARPNQMLLAEAEAAAVLQHCTKRGGPIAHALENQSQKKDGTRLPMGGRSLP
ncbi:uncharacterized protein TrAtP1_002104 [Trichoderma atroviride]|uniref:uncharacterized protein n=1 Tax=Hypocrea atroviridis TaxID=63577 RepID=UPI00332525F2|nr:hypothetical protein TrAtP1_002104 [Trichoderma atroviride]